MVGLGTLNLKTNILICATNVVMKMLKVRLMKVQERMMHQVRLRHTPILKFVADTRFKKTMETLQIIEQAMSEIRNEQDADGGPASETDDAAE